MSETCTKLANCGAQYTTGGCLIKHQNNVYKVWNGDGGLTYAQTNLQSESTGTTYNDADAGNWHLDGGMYAQQVRGHNPKCLTEDGIEKTEYTTEKACKDADNRWVGTIIPGQAVLNTPPCRQHPMLCSNNNTCERTDSINHKVKLDAGCLAKDGNNKVLLVNQKNKSTVTIEGSTALQWYKKCIANAPTIKDNCVDKLGNYQDQLTTKEQCEKEKHTWQPSTNALAGFCQHGNNCTVLRGSCVDKFGVDQGQLTNKEQCEEKEKHTWQSSTWGQFYCANAAPCLVEEVPGGVTLTTAQQIRTHVSKNNPEAIEPLCKLNADLCSRFTEGSVSATMCAQDPLGCANTITDPIGRCEYLPKTNGCPYVPPPPNEKDVVRLHYDVQTQNYDAKRTNIIFRVGVVAVLLVVGGVVLFVHDKKFKNK